MRDSVSVPGLPERCVAIYPLCKTIASSAKAKSAKRRGLHFQLLNSLKTAAQVSRFQVPLDLGFALTDYKSQGQTLDEVVYIADLSPDTSRHYVPVSRVRRGQSLTVVSADPFTVDALNVTVKADVRAYLQHAQPRLADTLNRAKALNPDDPVLAGLDSVHEQSLLPSLPRTAPAPAARAPPARGGARARGRPSRRGALSRRI